MKNEDVLAKEIIDRLNLVIGFNSNNVGLHVPEFNGEEEKLIIDCIKSTWVSSTGKYVDKFENEIARICGTNHGVAVVNGTAALEVALRVAGVEPNDEVLMPSMTFVATANATHHLGGIPHFIDVNEKTLGICPEKLLSNLKKIAITRNKITYNKLTNRKIKAIVPMHTFGHPVNVKLLNEIAFEFNLVVVEDASEALGSYRSGIPCGSLGSIAALSFNGNKIITTGGGGAIVTNNPKLAERAKHLTTTAKLHHRWAFFHDEIGYNYRMPNLNAALGIAQLKQLKDRVIKKRALAKAYIDTFSDLKGARIFEEPEEAYSNYWLNTIILDNENAHFREKLLKTINDNGYVSRPIWEPLHTLKIYSNCPKSKLKSTENLAKRIINIPSSSYLGDKFVPK